MTDRLRLSPRHRRILTSLLREHLPDVEVWAYGSRVNERGHEGSDLDLVLRGPQLRKIPFERLMDFEDSVRESTIPFLVEARDWARLPERFHREIEREYVVLVSSDTRWQEARLGDVIRLVSGGTPSKKREEYWNGAIPWVSARDMRRFRLRDTTHHVTAEGLANGTKQVPVGTILLLTRGMRLLKELPVCVTERPMAFNQDIKALLPKTRMDPDFLPYLVLGNKQRLLNLVDLAGHGTGRINSDELRALDVRLPPTSEQRAIAHILSKLDDKIELNRRMSEALEMMARALFRSWFVDFDPVRAKMNDRDTGFPQNIADLFPDRLMDSEMGQIPEGWHVATLAERIEVNPRRSLRRGQTAPYLPMANMPTQGHLPDAVAVRPFGSGMRFANGDTLVARITPCLENGKTAYVDFLADGEVGWGSTEYIVLRPKPPLPNQFGYFLARSARFREFATQNMSGTSGRQRVSPTALRGFRMVAPPSRVAARFGEVARSLFERVSKASHESHTLAALRDTLLPKLISGKIRVGDADKAMEFIA
ncbi:MAG: restriction endonuclease subunit S [Gammaproteobacteria bacterium]|nr:restriction endonuclease subunit S [Gammaproteobacteria bacterium]MDE0259168.1 restriction endonuclease subunit S [Gammaproteobacteria bacterium]